MKNLLIGISGGSGSGKTFLANKILKKYLNQSVIIEQDAYYKDLSNLKLNKRKLNNYDHPKSIEIKLLEKHIKTLLNGKPINKPVYDFSKHIRKKYIYLKPKPIIILEGILIYHFKQLLNLFSLKIFLDIKSDIRFIRRLKRDQEERNRTINNICEQYLNHVRPMHDKFVEPSKNNSDLIIKKENDFKNIFDIIHKKLDILK